MALSHVAIIHWPEEAAVATWLRAQGRPRLLLVAADADAPGGSDWDEDWIRLPARDDDVYARAAALESRSVRRGPGPDLRGDGRLRFGDRWVALSQTEEVILGVLTEHFGEVVEADSLASAFRGRRLSPTSVRVHLTRLRKRIAPIGLVVRTVRGRGYVLDAASEDGPVPPLIPAVIRQPRTRDRGRAESRRDHTNDPQDGDDAVLVIGDLVVDASRHRVSVGERRVDLTPTELRFLTILARQAGELVPYAVILEKLWGRGVNDNQYVHVYAAKIRKKLGDDPASPRLVTEPRVGYRLIDPLEKTA